MSFHSAYSRYQKELREPGTPTPSKKSGTSAAKDRVKSPRSPSLDIVRPCKQARFEQGSPQLHFFDSSLYDDIEDIKPKTEGDEEITSEVDNSKIMAICRDRSSGHKVAAVLFDSGPSKLYVMEDTADSTRYDQIHLLLEQLQPDIIYSSAKTPDALINRINQYCSSNTHATLELLSRKLFTTATARTYLASIKLPDQLAKAAEAASDDPISSRFSHAQTESSFADIDSLGLGSVRLAVLKMGCWVNVEAPLAACALGAVIAQVQQQRAFGALPGDDAGFVVNGIESLSLEQHMFITQETLQRVVALEVFQPGASATAHVSISRQAISLFGVMDTTRTIDGRHLLERWFLRPLTSIEAITHRHDAISLFSSHENVGVAEKLKLVLKKTNRTVAIVNTIKAGFGGLQDWKKLAVSLDAAIQIKAGLRELIVPRHLPSYPLLLAINDSVSESVAVLYNDIMTQIDWISSDEENRICFHAGIDQVMEDLKDRLASLQPTLDHLASQIALSITPNYCRDLNVVCFPQLGYLLACTLHHPDAYNVNVPPGWELQFFSDVFYFKDEHMRDLDETFGDLQSLLQDREIDLVLELAKLMMVAEPSIVLTMDTLAELDCILALSQAVETYSLTRPRVVPDNVLLIKQGRHLLQECLVNVYVPNDVDIGTDDKTMLMTGANGSGKTAYGKMVALIVFMAQIGSFVPAESATVGVRTSILTCLNAKESVSSMSSSFMLQLQQISMTLRLANDRAMVLVDELGKGTLPQDGSSLLVGVLQSLLNSRALSVVITHFRPPMLPTEKLKQAHMQSIISEDRNAPDMSFLYQCRPGPSASSQAGACALMYGIPPEIVKRAHQASVAIAAYDLKFDSTPTADEKERLRRADAVVRAFLPLRLADEEDPMSTVKALLERM